MESRPAHLPLRVRSGKVWQRPQSTKDSARGGQTQRRRPAGRAEDRDPILPEMLLPSGVQSDLTRLALGLGKATAAGAESESESRAGVILKATRGY